MTDLQTLIRYQGVVGQLIAMGVTTWKVIRAALQDAGADEATIDALAPKYDALVDDVRRSAGQ